MANVNLDVVFLDDGLQVSTLGTNDLGSELGRNLERVNHRLGEVADDKSLGLLGLLRLSSDQKSSLFGVLRGCTLDAGRCFSLDRVDDFDKLWSSNVQLILCIQRKGQLD